MNPQQEAQLQRGIGVFGLTAMAVNCTVGAGVLGLPGKVFALAGRLTLPLMAAAALLALVIALCLAELGSRFSETGGPYIYIDRAFGHGPGFIAAWLSWSGVVLAAASLLNLFADYALPLFFFTETWAHRALFIIILASIITTLVLQTTRNITALGSLLFLAKIFILVCIAFAGLTSVPTENFEARLPTNIASGLLLLFFGFVGFERVTAVAGEIRNPRINLPIALIVSVAVIAALYGAVFLACLRAAPNLAFDGQPLATIAKARWGSGVGLLVSAGALVILLGTLITQFVTTPRLLLALAEDGRLPRVMGRLSLKRATPDVAILTTAIVIVIFALTGDFVSDLSTSVSSRMLIYIGCFGALIKLRGSKRWPAEFRIPWGVPVAGLGIFACATIVVLNGSKEVPKLAIIVLTGILLDQVSRRLLHR